MTDLPTRLRENLYGIDEADERLANEAADEIERLHSWKGLMSLLDEIWPAGIFSGSKLPESGPGPRILTLIREVDRLKAIVDKIPTCWGLTDGKLLQDVPVVPGMTVYYEIGGTIKGEYLEGWGDVVAFAYGWRHEIYATKAAAQAALDAKEEKHGGLA